MTWRALDNFLGVFIQMLNFCLSAARYSSPHFRITARKILKGTIRLARTIRARVRLPRASSSASALAYSHLSQPTAQKHPRVASRVSGIGGLGRIQMSVSLGAVVTPPFASLKTGLDN
jgi:hypothetical protein